MLDEILDEIASRIGCALLPGAEVARNDGIEAQGEDLVSVIGFSGDAVRGALGIVAPAATVTAVHPDTAAGLEVTEAGLEDWIGELANQLLGRFKVELLQRGVTLWMSTPLVLRGVSVRVVTGTDRVRRYNMKIGGGGVTFWLDFRAAPGIELAEVEPAPVLHGPGEMLLF